MLRFRHFTTWFVCCRLLFSGSILALDLIEDFLDMISEEIEKGNDEITKSVSIMVHLKRSVDSDSLKEKLRLRAT